MLFKDYRTQKQSFTMTATVLTFLLVIATFLGTVTHAIDESTVWAAIAFHVIYVGLYWNKRIKATRDGIEFGRDNKE